MMYLSLFWSFLQIGFLSIGGGMAALPLIQQQVVEINGWLTLSDLTDLITIAEMTPGPLAVNAATFVGINIAGIPGALIATTASLLPGLIMALCLMLVYRRYKELTVVQGVLSGIKPVVVSLIASAGAAILIISFWQGGQISLGNTDWMAIVLCVLALAALRKYKVNPIWVLVACGIVGGVIYSIG